MNPKKNAIAYKGTTRGIDGLDRASPTVRGQVLTKLVITFCVCDCEHARRGLLFVGSLALVKVRDGCVVAGSWIFVKIRKKI